MMWRYLARSLSSAIAWILHDDRGISGTVVTIALPGLIGFGALGVETGLWYTIKFRNQSAADAAAISAAYEVLAGKTDVTGDLTPAASEAATQNGYTGTTPAAVIYPYSDSLVSNGVAVALEQTQGTFLASMFLSGVKIATKSVAVIEVLENPCILALGTSGRGVEISDLSGIDMPECSEWTACGDGWALGRTAAAHSSIATQKIVLMLASAEQLVCHRYGSSGNRMISGRNVMADDQTRLWLRESSRNRAYNQA